MIRFRGTEFKSIKRLADYLEGQSIAFYNGRLYFCGRRVDKANYFHHLDTLKAEIIKQLLNKYAPEPVIFGMICIQKGDELMQLNGPLTVSELYDSLQ